MSNPKISVILPFFNGESTIADSIRSILNQTYGDYEILLLNDGSMDGTLSIARGFNDARIRVFSDTINKGLTCRLNQGIDLARGSYIARMDQDDLCFPERFEKQVAFLDSNPDVDLVGCRAVVFRDRDTIVGLMPFYGATHQDICGSPWNSIRLAHPTWMGRSKWFRNYRYRVPEVLLAEDQELLLRAHPNSRFACLDEVLLAYRRVDFCLYKNLQQRLSLLRMQFPHFVSQHQLSYAMRATVVIAVKILVDIIASLPGCERLFFARMNEKVPDSVYKQLDELKINGLL